VEKTRIRSGGGEVAAVHHAADSEAWVFLCHGFGSDKEGSHAERARFLVENGFNAVRFDFRGNGESTGDFVESTLSTRIEDLVSAVEYFGPGTYSLFGSSVGGKVVYFGLEELEPELVTLRAPALLDRSMSKYAIQVERGGEVEVFDGKSIDRRLIRDLDGYGFGSVEVGCPIQIFQGTEDIYAPVEQTREALGGLNSRVEYQELPGEGHSFSDEAEQEMRRLWLEALRRTTT